MDKEDSCEPNEPTNSFTQLRFEMNEEEEEARRFQVLEELEYNYVTKTKPFLHIWSSGGVKSPLVVFNWFLYGMYTLAFFTYK